MNIRRQILLLPLAVVVIACALMAAGMFAIGTKTDHVTRARELEVAEATLRGAIAQKLTDALDRAESIAALPAVQAAVAARDDAALEGLLAPAWAALRDQTGVEQLQVHIPPATSLIRIHDLAKRGDDLSGFRKMVVDANGRGISLKGIEAGRAGLGARGVAIIKSGGKPVGTVEVGLDIGAAFLSELAVRSGYDFEFYALPKPGQPVLTAEDAGAARLASTQNMPPLLGAAQLEALRRGGSFDANVDISGAHHMMRAVALQDYAGVPVGVITVAAPTAIYDAINQTSALMAAGVSLLALMIGAAIAWGFGRGIVGQITGLARVTAALAQGARDVAIPGLGRGDALGDMARALEVFAANQREAERMQEALREEEENARRAEAARRAQEAEAEALRAAQQAEAEALRQQREAEAHEAQRRRAEEAQARLDEQARVVSVLAEGLETLAQGDLARPIAEALPGDYERLRLNFNATIEQLAAALRAINASAARIDGEAVAIARANEDLSQNTERNAATLEQTAAALNQLTVSVRSAAEGASAARDLAAGARSDAESGVGVVNQAVEAMSQIEGSAQSISRITGVIDDIAFQTNLLALNAGVEAARAGEAGRGFAVVASEVRALAQRSSEAAKEISALIAASDQQVRSGVALVSQTGAALAKIVSSVRDISDRVTEIAVSAGEQAGGIAEINAAVNQLDRTTQQTAAMFDRTAESSRALVQESAGLIDAVRIFRLEPETRPAAPPHQAFAAE
ncbi:MAG: hypothetical protein IE922_08690 [Sphingomonadales bacterium]|nr:hypothetical protein [Sphingomonadales bacterium]